MDFLLTYRCRPPPLSSQINNRTQQQEKTARGDWGCSKSNAVYQWHHRQLTLLRRTAKHTQCARKYDDFGQQERTYTVIDLGFKRFSTEKKSHKDQNVLNWFPVFLSFLNSSMTGTERSSENPLAIVRRQENSKEQLRLQSETTFTLKVGLYRCLFYVQHRELITLNTSI